MNQRLSHALSLGPADTLCPLGLSLGTERNLQALAKFRKSDFVLDCRLLRCRHVYYSNHNNIDVSVVRSCWVWLKYACVL